MNPSAEDRLEITELLAKYGLYIDTLRTDELSALFTEDAVMDVPGRGELSTPDARLGMVLTAPRGLHLCAPPILRSGDSDDTVLGEQSFMFRSARSGKALVGWYDDVLVKRNDSWQIARRKISYMDPPAPRAEPSPG